jgi:hypothetical protein
VVAAPDPAAVRSRLLGDLPFTFGDGLAAAGLIRAVVSAAEAAV